jgi:hypothetical protein
MSIVFDCAKDPLLARHYETKFKARFTDQWDCSATPNERAETWSFFTKAMRIEARRQQYYDFVLQGDGDFVPHRRVLLRDSDGEPTLLIPTIRIEP